MSIPLNKIMSQVTPLFNKEIGRRMAKIRMKRFLEQSELAHQLGISQQNVSAIETGRIRIVPKLTLARFVAVFHVAANYILLGTSREKFETGNPEQAYWDHKNAERIEKKEITRKRNLALGSYNSNYVNSDKHYK